MTRKEDVDAGKEEGYIASQCCLRYRSPTSPVSGARSILRRQKSAFFQFTQAFMENERMYQEKASVAQSTSLEPPAIMAT